MRSNAKVLALIGLLGAAGTGQATGADLVAPGSYSPIAIESPCGDAGYINAIQRRFALQAREVHERPGMAIVEVANIQENRYVASYDQDPRSLPNVAVPRVYCKATALMSDGGDRSLWYLIEFGEGFAGFIGDNVEFCLSGLDPWKIYNGNCRVLR